MPQETKAPAANKAAAGGGDHDRVAMLSLRADGTPDQHAPEIIGDKDTALAATTEQFRQQAVSAADIEKRGVTAGPGGGEELEQDPQIVELQKAHEAAEKSAESAAKKTVEGLHQGLGDSK